MRWPIALILSASGAWAQTGASNPLVESSKVFYSNAKQDILGSAEKMPDDKYAFKPTDTVRHSLWARTAIVSQYQRVSSGKRVQV